METIEIHNGFAIFSVGFIGKYLYLNHNHCPIMFIKRKPRIDYLQQKLITNSKVVELNFYDQ